jgi:Tfp pilus assembly protein PilZ
MVQQRDGAALGAEQGRRSAERHAVELPVVVQKEDGSVIQAQARNLSIGGAYVETDAPASFGAKVVLRFSLPGLGAPAEIEATVRWTKPNGMGVQFGPTGAKLTYALTEFLRARR